MRLVLILTIVLSAAGAAHAQYQPIQPIGAPKNPYALPHAAAGPETFKPYTPPKLPSVYADGPFSPAGEARRERRANMAPPPGPFSPEGEARRQRKAAKDFHPF